MVRLNAEQCDYRAGSDPPGAPQFAGSGAPPDGFGVVRLMIRRTRGCSESTDTGWSSGRALRADADVPERHFWRARRRLSAALTDAQREGLLRTVYAALMIFSKVIASVSGIVSIGMWPDSKLATGVRS
jgi:hypothetical protein